MVAKKYQHPEGGLNEAGRKFFKRTEGANLKSPTKTTKKGTKDFSRRVSFASRFSGMKGPERDEKGRPTNLLKALQRWGFRSKESARNFANRHKKSKASA